MSPLLRAAFLVFSLTISFRSAAAQTAPVPARITQAIDEKKMVSLPGNVHPLARTEFDQGPVADAQPLRRMLLLLQRGQDQEAALRQLLDDQQNKSSPNYHAWLTPDQFGKQFGPADSDIQTLTQWLRAQGFSDIRVGPGRTVIEFSGNVAIVRNTFHTEIHRYLVDGQEHVANAGDPQIPAALKPAIAGIVSLHSFRKKPMYRLAAIPAGPDLTFQCIDFFTSIFGAFPGQSASCHGLGPYDFATIYDVLPLWNATPPIDGTGQTIAIVGRTNINLQDVSDFRNLFGLPPSSPQIILDGPDPGLVRGDETEADLDVEWSGAVAKGATIELVVSESTETSDGVDLSALYIVDHNLAPVMSESYGQCEFNLGAASNQFYNNLWQQAAAQGITAFVSSGDNGSAGCDFELNQGLPPPQPAQYGLQVNGIASTPYNVAVGGTDFNDYFNASTYWNSTSNAITQESAKGYIPETTWNDSCTNAILEDPRFPLSSNAETNCNNASGNAPILVLALGGSGGKSNCTAPTGTTVSSCAGGYAKPGWQAAPGVPADGKRDLPDVSLFASNGFVDSFYIMCEANLTNLSSCSPSNFVGVGGTSASSPAFAGLLALVNQKTGSRQGNPNYVLYSLAAKQSSSSCNSSTGPAPACVFNDITSGTIAMPCVTGSTNCATANGSDKIGILSGYQAGAGYDLATGLGSVNANNLVNSWNTGARTSSATTLALNGGNAVNITHGTPVGVAVSVSPASPSPTGFASLLAVQGSESFGLDTFTVSNGTASGTTHMLPGGVSYLVHAHYAGDADYGASDSGSTTVTVNPEPSGTTVRVATLDLSTGQVSNPNATSIPYGSVYLLRADVTNTSGASCFSVPKASLSYACPSGTVSFGLDGASLGPGPAPLNSEGYAENQTVQLTVGSHTFQGSYSGDNSYLASSSTDSVSVTPAPTITGTQNLFPVPIGVPVGFSVIARSNDYGLFGVPMSGTFTFFDGSTQLSVSEYTLTGVIFPAPGSPYVWETLDGEITITFSGSPGPHALTVKYSGDANYSPSTSAPGSFNAVYTTQTTLTSSAPTILDGQPLTVTASIFPSQAASSPPSGNVAFTVNGVPFGTVGISNSQSQITIPSLTAGNIPIRAAYSGDSNYASSSGTFTQTVTPVSTSTIVTSSSLTVSEGVLVTLTAQITPAQMGAAPLTGGVGFTANGSFIGSHSVSNNQAQITTIFFTPGSVQVQATYIGDVNYLTSAGTLTETVVSPPDFSVSSSGTTSVTVPAGQTANFSNAISVSALNGFASPVNLSCALPISATSTTCSVNPSSFPSGSGTASVNVTTMTRGLVPLLFPRLRFHFWPQLLFAALLAVFLAVVLLRFARTRRQRFAGAIPLAGLVLFLVLQTIGCGGGGYSSPPPPPPPTGTPAGTYTVTVTATSGTLTHTTTLTIVVQ